MAHHNDHTDFRNNLNFKSLSGVNDWIFSHHFFFFFFVADSAGGGGKFGGHGDPPKTTPVFGFVWFGLAGMV